MKADLTRNTFHPFRHFTQVLMQQGRVQLDADWNEQAFATGSGVVNQESIDLSRWGLGEFPWTSV